MRHHAPGFFCNISQVTSAEVQSWLFETKGHLSQNARRHYFKDLTTFFTWVVDEELRDDLPIDKKLEPRKAPTKTEVLTVAQARLLLDAVRGTDLLAPLVLGLFCGIRTKELKRLTWADIRLDGKKPLVTLDEGKTKTIHRRTIELKPVAVAWLRTCMKQQGPIAGHLKQKLRDLHRRLKRDHAEYRYPHNGLRHSFASYAFEQWGLDWTLSSLGHVGSATTFKSHYHNIVSPEAADAFWQLFPAAEGNVVPMTPATAAAQHSAPSLTQAAG